VPVAFAGVHRPGKTIVINADGIAANTANLTIQ